MEAKISWKIFNKDDKILFSIKFVEITPIDDAKICRASWRDNFTFLLKIEIMRKTYLHG